MTKSASSTVGQSNDIGISQPPVRNDLLSVVRRRISTFIVVSIVVYALVLVALVVIPVRYVATSSIIVAEQSASLDSTQPVGADKLGDPADLESQILLIKSPRLLRQVIERPEVKAALGNDCQDQSHDAAPGAAARRCPTPAPDPNTIVEQLQSHYAVSAVGRSRVINIAFDSQIPSVAQTLANALTTAFLDDRHESWIGTSQSSAISLKHDLEQLNQSLHEDEERIQAFRNKNGLIRGSLAPIGSERLSSISQSLIAAESAKADAGARLEEIEKAAKTSLTDSPTIMGNRTITDLRQQLVLLEIEYARTSATLGPRHPSILSIEQARDALKGRINLELEAVAAGARKTYETATALVNGLRQKMHSVQTDAASAEDEEASMAELLRTVDSKRAKYAELSKEITRIETQTPAYTDTTRLVSLAELPTSPYFPKRQPFLIGGLVLALLLGGGATIVADRMNLGARAAPVAVAVSRAGNNAGMGVGTGIGMSTGDTPATGLPVIGEFPLIRSSPLQGLLRRLALRGEQISPVAVLQRGRDDAGFRAAVGNMMSTLALYAQSGTLKTVMLTSPHPREGRTVTTIALGYGLAASGKRTLIIEADLHNPTIAQMLKLGKSPGLAGLLQNQLSIEAATLPTASPTLFIIPAGQRVRNAGSALAGPKMAELLIWARQFDYVLIDTPSHKTNRDACALAQMIDAVICCSRPNGDSRDLALTLQDLTLSGGQLLGTVSTMVDTTQHAPFGSAPVAYQRAVGVNA